MLSLASISGQGQTPTLAAPTVFRLAGNLQTQSGEPRTGVVVLVASLYSEQTDVSPLWSEAHTVTLESTGRYSILVGSTLEGGVPAEYFLRGTGRWLGLSVQGETEQPRMMLVTVPYALKAVEADMLSGKTAADFVLANGSQGALGSRPVSNVTTAINRVAKFTDAIGGVGDSTISEVGGAVSFSNMTLGVDGTYVGNYRSVGFSGNTNGKTRIFGTTDDSDNLYLAAGTGRGINFWVNGGTGNVMSLSPAGLLTVQSLTNNGASTLNAVTMTSLTNTGSSTLGNMTLGQDGTYLGNYRTLGFGGNTNGRTRIFGTSDDSDNLYLAAGTNRGINFWVNGSSANVMVLSSSGNVGIGTASPTAKLDVAGNINVSGNINAKYQDVAEWVETSKPLEAGTVVVVDQTALNRVVASTRAYDTGVAGAVSAQPGLILGEAGDDKAMVAQSGRVRIKVDATYGAVKVGDLLVTSPTPGYAMRSRPMLVGGVPVHRAGTILGKALEALPNGRGEILVLLTLQ